MYLLEQLGLDASAIKMEDEIDAADDGLGSAKRVRKAAAKAGKAKGKSKAKRSSGAAASKRRATSKGRGGKSPKRGAAASAPKGTLPVFARALGRGGLYAGRVCCGRGRSWGLDPGCVLPVRVSVPRKQPLTTATDTLLASDLCHTGATAITAHLVDDAYPGACQVRVDCLTVEQAAEALLPTAATTDEARRVRAVTALAKERAAVGGMPAVPLFPYVARAGVLAWCGGSLPSHGAGTACRWA